MSKSRKVVRPKMPKTQTSGRIVPVHLTEDDLQWMREAAKSNNQSLPDWILTTLRKHYGIRILV